MEKKKELIYHTYNTLYTESLGSPGNFYIVAISGFLYRVKRRLWGFIPLPCKYIENVEAKNLGPTTNGRYGQLMISDFPSKDQKAVEKKIQEVKNVLINKRKELSKRKKK